MGLSTVYLAMFTEGISFVAKTCRSRESGVWFVQFERRDPASLIQTVVLKSSDSVHIPGTYPTGDACPTVLVLTSERCTYC